MKERRRMIEGINDEITQCSYSDPYLRDCNLSDITNDLLTNHNDNHLDTKVHQTPPGTTTIKSELSY